jgi:hypothetical protein
MLQLHCSNGKRAFAQRAALRVPFHGIGRVVAGARNRTGIFLLVSRTETPLITGLLGGL